MSSTDEVGQVEAARPPLLIAATAIGQLVAVIGRCADAEGVDWQDILRDLNARVEGLDDTEDVR